MEFIIETTGTVVKYRVELSYQLVACRFKKLFLSGAGRGGVFRRPVEKPILPTVSSLVKRKHGPLRPTSKQLTVNQAAVPSELAVKVIRFCLPGRQLQNPF
jgi:hypothetical protein